MHNFIVILITLIKSTSEISFYDIIKNGLYRSQLPSEKMIKEDNRITSYDNCEALNEGDYVIIPKGTIIVPFTDTNLSPGCFIYYNTPFIFKNGIYSPIPHGISIMYNGEEKQNSLHEDIKLIGLHDWYFKYIVSFEMSIKKYNIISFNSLLDVELLDDTIHCCVTNPENIVIKGHMGLRDFVPASFTTIFRCVLTKECQAKYKSGMNANRVITLEEGFQFNVTLLNLYGIGMSADYIGKLIYHTQFKIPDKSKDYPIYLQLVSNTLLLSGEYILSKSANKIELPYLKSPIKLKDGNDEIINIDFDEPIIKTSNSVWKFSSSSLLYHSNFGSPLFSKETIIGNNNSLKNLYENIKGEKVKLNVDTHWMFNKYISNDIIEIKLYYCASYNENDKIIKELNISDLWVSNSEYIKEIIGDTIDNLKITNMLNKKDNLTNDEIKNQFVENLKSRLTFLPEKNIDELVKNLFAINVKDYKNLNKEDSVIDKIIMKLFIVLKYPDMLYNEVFKSNKVYFYLTIKDIYQKIYKTPIYIGGVINNKFEIKCVYDNKKSYVYDSYKSDCLSTKLFKIISLLLFVTILCIVIYIVLKKNKFFNIKMKLNNTIFI